MKHKTNKRQIVLILIFIGLIVVSRVGTNFNDIVFLSFPSSSFASTKAYLVTEAFEIWSPFVNGYPLFWKNTDTASAFIIRSLRYNDEPAIPLDTNRFTVSTGKSLRQTIAFPDNTKLIAQYASRKNMTTIIHVAADGTKEKETREGKVFLQLITDKGALRPAPL